MSCLDNTEKIYVGAVKTHVTGCDVLQNVWSNLKVSSALNNLRDKNIVILRPALSEMIDNML